VFNGVNGLISEREPAAMGRALSRLRSDPRLRRQLISGGFDFVSADRSVSGGAQELASIIAKTAQDSHIP
jgi:glycosyltransferase involved in cell wall biosynthesis